VASIARQDLPGTRHSLRRLSSASKSMTWC